MLSPAAREFMKREETEKNQLRKQRAQIPIGSSTKAQHERIMVPVNIGVSEYRPDTIYFRFCPQCGAELYGYDQHIRNGECVIGSFSTCPICSSRLKFGHGYYDSEYIKYIEKEPNGLHRFFDSMEDLRVPVEVQKFDEHLSQMEGRHIPVVEEIPSARIAEIKADPEKLKEYITNLVKLEGNIYSIKQRLAVLYYQRLQADRAILFATKKSEYVFEQQRSAANELQKNQQLLTAQTEVLQRLKTENLPNPDSVIYPPKPQEPRLLPVGLFDFAVGNKAKNQSMMSEYEKQMEDYKRKTAECNRERARLKDAIKTQHSKIAQVGSQINEIRNDIAKSEAKLKDINGISGQSPIPAHGVKTMIDKEIQQAEEVFNNLLDARSKLYSFDIVFGKYRDLAILSTFHEYLMTGRCTSLEGVNGAYNLYESELRSNIIIGKLSDVLTSLEELKNQLNQTQYTIISLLHDVNGNLQNLNHKMDSACSAIYDIRDNTADTNKFLGQIAENSKVIAYNTAATAYYSKVNAELTNSMGYLMAYKL